MSGLETPKPIIILVNRVYGGHYFICNKVVVSSTALINKCYISFFLSNHFFYNYYCPHITVIRLFVPTRNSRILLYGYKYYNIIQRSNIGLIGSKIFLGPIRVIVDGCSAGFLGINVSISQKPTLSSSR